MKLTAFGAVVGDKESGSFGLSVHKTLEEAIAAFDLENGGEGEEAAAAGGQSCMFASVYETPFEDMDAAVSAVSVSTPQRYLGESEGGEGEGGYLLLTSPRCSSSLYKHLSLRIILFPTPNHSLDR